MLKSTLEQWRMFKAVVDAGGFNQAAAEVHKSQSSVHHAVQKLENAIGVSLFENIGRKVQLSPQGELMYRRASFLLSEAHKLEAVANAQIWHRQPYAWGLFSRLNCFITCSESFC